MKKTTTKKLLNYGTMSMALIGAATATGQIVYVDIDDIDVTADGSASIDLDEDGTIDYSPAAGATAAVIYAGDGGTGSNAFVGFSAGAYNYNSNLAAGTLIDAASPTSPPGARVDLNFNGCAYSNSQFCDGVVDGYTGLIFDIGGNTHYGWMRVDVAADGSGFLVKAYAYESTPDTGIMAGDEGMTANVEDQVFANFTFAVNNGALTLDAQTAMSGVEIYDITGKRVISNELANSTETVNISSLSTGVHIARVTIEGAEKTFKFVK